MPFQKMLDVTLDQSAGSLLCQYLTQSGLLNAVDTGAHVPAAEAASFPDPSVATRDLGGPTRDLVIITIVSRDYEVRTSGGGFIRTATTESYRLNPMDLIVYAALFLRPSLSQAERLAIETVFNGFQPGDDPILAEQKLVAQGVDVNDYYVVLSYRIVRRPGAPIVADDQNDANFQNLIALAGLKCAQKGVDRESCGVPTTRPHGIEVGDVDHPPQAPKPPDPDHCEDLITLFEYLAHKRITTEYLLVLESVTIRIGCEIGSVEMYVLKKRNVTTAIWARVVGERASQAEQAADGCVKGALTAALVSLILSWDLVTASQVFTGSVQLCLETAVKEKFRKCILPSLEEFTQTGPLDYAF